MPPRSQVAKFRVEGGRVYGSHRYIASKAYQAYKKNGAIRCRDWYGVLSFYHRPCRLSAVWSAWRPLKHKFAQWIYQASVVPFTTTTIKKARCLRTIWPIP